MLVGGILMGIGEEVEERNGHFYREEEKFSQLTAIFAKE